VLPHFNQGDFGAFVGTDGIEIAYAKFEVENEKGALVILHGLNETYNKYAELIYDLRDTGYSIYIMEHRGHGHSGRILDGSAQERRKIYVKDFSDYVNDTKIFYDTVVNATAHDKHLIFAHSVGGNVATQYLQQYPQDFDGAVLSSPLMQVLTTHPFSVGESFGYAVSKAAVDAGQGKAYALDMKEPSVLIDSTSPEKFEQELLTKSWKRWQVYNEIIEQQPELIAGGPGATWGVTNQFGKVSYEATFKARSATEAAKIVVPVLMFQSGDDRIVGSIGLDTLRQNAVNAPSFEVVEFPDAYHEAYMERDFIRNELVAETKAFLERF
jgi:lysophospholipase